MGRLVDIDSLKGCAIIRPTSHESIEHIKQCGNDVLNHNDIPTAYDVDAVVAELGEFQKEAMSCAVKWAYEKSINAVKRGGV